MVFVISTITYAIDIIDSTQQKLSYQKIENVVQRYPDSLEIHLGATELYCFLKNEDAYKREYQEILRIMPQDRIAHTFLVYDIVIHHLLNLDKYYEELERAKKWERGEIKIPPDNPLYEFKEDKKIYENMAKNIRKNAEDIKTKLKENSWIMKELDRLQQIDPNNALYHYLKASIYFRNNNKEYGMSEIEKGIAKSYIGTYSKERVRARASILKEMDFPWPERAIIITWIVPFSTDLQKYLFKDLIKIGEDYEKNGKIEEAEKFYKKVVDIGEQCEQNAFFIFEKVLGISIKEMGLNPLNEFYKKRGKMQETEKISNELSALKKMKESLLNLLEKSYSYLDKMSENEVQSLINQVIEKGEITTLSSRY